MISIRMYATVAAAILAGMLSPNVHAAGTLARTYLSTSGKDTNPCTLAAPCRLLPAALAATQDGGEVWILDSGNYNTAKVSVSQSVTILTVPGAIGSLYTSNDNALEVSGSVNVTLRNVAFRKAGGDLGAGVYVGSGVVQLLVENSDFTGIGGGIVWQPSASGQVGVHHSTFRNNGIGIGISGAGVNAVIDHCNIVGLRNPNASGTAVSVFAANVVISHSSITHSYFGITANGGANITLEDNVIADNTTGVEFFDPAEGGVTSNGTNTFQINSTNVDGGSLTSGTRM